MKISEWKDFTKTKEEKGDIGETIFYHYMLDLYPDTSTHLFYFNDDGRYDLLHHNLLTHWTNTYELKTDWKVTPNSINSNMFVEFESHGKPSGISTTISTYWVNYFLHLNQLWIIPTEDLQYIITEYNGLSKAPKYNKKGEIESWGYIIPFDSCSDIIDRFEIISL